MNCQSCGKRCGRNGTCRNCGWDKVSPSQAEIAADCEAIQATWTPAERRKRSAPVRPVDLRVVQSMCEEPSE